jgi:uncharacterized membrane protein
MHNKTRLARNLTLVGYLGTVLLIPTWIWWLAPPEILSQTATTIIWFTPLLLPLWGILSNKPFTYAWSGFLAVLYLSQAITTLVSTPAEQGLALIELILTSLWLAGATMFSRWRGEELGLEIRKAKPAEDQQPD